MICSCGKPFYQWLSTQTKCPKCQLLQTDVRRSKRAYKSQEDARFDKTEAQTQIVEQTEPKKAKRPNKRKERQRLIEELDRVFSLFIRQRFSDSNGLVKCFTSGAVCHWKQSQAGHFISRRHMSTRWDEHNVQVQSVAENMFNQGNAPVFAQRLKEKYGEKVVEQLLIKKNNLWTPTEFELRTLIGIYRDKLKELEHGRKV